jgi:hypothetical protein
MDEDGSGQALIAYDRPSGFTDRRGIPNSGEYGVYAYGNKAGGYFEDANGTGHAYIGYADTGIWGWGTYAGGDFRDTDGSGWGRVGYGTYKIYGSGAVSFVQNHPEDPSSVIVYAAPEGDEVATYTRGTARLVDGKATVSLGETFRWVTNPDIGLTAHLTPRDHPTPLAVVELSTEEMRVRAADDAPEGLVFDYIVYGLRIGFEESTVVQEKPQEAYIPSMKDHRELLARRPDLARYTALSRFVEQRRAMGTTEELDTGRAKALVAAIHEFDPAVDAAEQLEPHASEESLGGDGSSGAEGLRRTEQDRGDLGLARSRGEARRVPGRSDLAGTIPVDGEGSVYAPSFRPSSREVASLVEVSEAVEAGDVLVIDQASVGMMRKGFEGHDAGVVGVVSEHEGVMPVSQSLELPDDELRAAVAMAGVVRCKVDAAFGAIWPGDLLVTSPTPGHAMRTEAPLPGTIVGKALEPLGDGTGLIRVLVMLR